MGSERLFPFGFDFADDVADRESGGVSSGGEVDAFGTLVVGVVAAGEVAESFELSEQVVERLFGHVRAGGELRGAQVLGAGVLEEIEVRGYEVAVAALVQAGEHAVAYRLER